MRDLHDRVLHRRPRALPAVHAHLPHRVHRRLAHEELHLPLLHGARRRRPPRHLRDALREDKLEGNKRSRMDERGRHSQAGIHRNRHAHPHGNWTEEERVRPTWKVVRVIVAICDTTVWTWAWVEQPWWADFVPVRLSSGVREASIGTPLRSRSGFLGVAEWTLIGRVKLLIEERGSHLAGRLSFDFLLVSDDRYTRRRDQGGRVRNCTGPLCYPFSIRPCCLVGRWAFYDSRLNGPLDKCTSCWSNPLYLNPSLLQVVLAPSTWQFWLNFITPMPKEN